MAREVVYLPTADAGAVLGVMGFLAVLAYPERRDIPKRDKLITALKAGLIKQVVPRGNARRRYLDQLTGFANRDIGLTVGKALNTIESRRFPAARMLRCLLVNARGDMFLEQGEYPRTINQCAAILDLERNGEEGAANIKHRQWAESKPVVHLAHALWVHMFHSPEAHYLNPETGAVDVWRIVRIPEWLPRVLEEAENIRQSLKLYNPNVSIEEADTISVLPRS